MNKNQKKKLEELKIELDAYVLMSQLVLSMMGKAGQWQKSSKSWPHSEDVVYWDDLDGVGVSVDDDGNFKAFNDTDFVCPITLPKFIEVIEELAPKAKGKKAKKPTEKKPEKKFYVIYCEHGEDCLGGHRDEWRKRDEAYDTREEAIEALKKDMEYYKQQWGGDVSEFETDGWNIIVIDDTYDASCEWDIAELKPHFTVEVDGEAT